YARYRLYGGEDPLLNAGGGGNEQGGPPAAAPAPAYPPHEHADPPRGGPGGGGEAAPPPNPPPRPGPNHGHNHNRRGPAVGLEMQGVGLEGLAVVLLRGARQHARSRRIDDDRSDHHGERPEGYVDFDFQVQQPARRFPDDPDAGDQQQHGFGEGREIL